MKTRISHAALLGLLVFVCARLGLAWFVLPPAAVAAVWPASGVVLAALLLAPTAAWPLLLLSAGLATGLAQIWAGSPPLVSLLLALAHLAAALLAAALVRRWSAARLTMNRLRDLVGMVLIAAVASNALTALLGAGVAWASLGAPFGQSWLIWFIADSTSIVVLTPLALSWLGPARPALRGLTRRRAGEAVALGAALLLVSGGAFAANRSADGMGMTLFYPLLFPLLIWAVLRFQMRGTTLATVIFASLVTLGATHGQGPFVALTASPLAAILAAQRYLAVSVASAYVMAALVAERITEHAAQVQAREALRASEARYRTISELTSDYVYTLRVGPDGQVTYEWVTASFETVTGYTPAALEAAGGWPLLMVADDAPIIQARAARLFAGIDDVSEFRIRTRSGAIRWLQDYARPICDASGQVVQMVGAVRDITALRQSEAALRASEQRWQFAINAANDGLWDWNIQTGEVFFSERWQIMLGYTPGEVIGHVDSWERIVHPEDLPWVMATLQAHLDGHTMWYECEHRCQTKRGDWVWILDRGQVIVRDATGRPLRAVGTYSDVSARHALEAELRAARDHYAFQASHDVLTGLLNRPAITDHVLAELARVRRGSEPLSLALLDIDRFKAVNDQHGHLVGDQALRHVAQILTETVRPYDWVGRWGGEEFLVVLPGTALDMAVVVAERLRAQIAARPLRLADEADLPLTMSIGVACTERAVGSDGDLEHLFQQADAALYRAKHQGRNQVSRVELVAATSARPVQAASTVRSSQEGCMRWSHR